MRRHQSTEIELSMEKAESLAEEIKSRCDIDEYLLGKRRPHTELRSASI